MLCFRLPAFLLVVSALGLNAFAAEPEAAREVLEKAKVARTAELSKARGTLLASIDVYIKAAGGAGDLDALKALTTQKDAFVATGVLPNLPSLKDPVTQYTAAMRKADGELLAAYESAIQAYVDAKNTAEADLLRRERQQLIVGNAAPIDSPEAFAIVLDRAKADYQTAISEARRAYVQAIVGRIDAATKDGDLAAVTRFRAARTAAETDQALPADVSDSIVTGARSRFNSAIQIANQRLALTYREIVRGLTRANKIEQAIAMQGEFDATGLNGTGRGPRTTTSASGDNSSKLTRTLPPYLTASGAFSTEKEGIKPASDCTISTNTSDFFTKDFIFEVAIAVPKENDGITVGIGDFSDKGSLRVTIYDDGGWGRTAHLAVGQEWSKKMGKIHPGEEIVVRIERHEGPITASVGAYVQGKFVSEMTQTVADPKRAISEMSEKRGKLFFSGTARFLHVRLATGAATKADAAADASGAVAGAMGIVKFPNSNAAPAAAVPPPVVVPAPVVIDPAKGFYKLNSPKLPPGFTAEGTFTATAAGIVPAEKCKIVTTDEDYFSKDFRFDVTLQVPPKAGWLEVGVGDTSQEASFRFSIRQDHGNKPIVSLCLGDRWGKEAGKLGGVGEQYILRIEHLGPSLTFSAGQMKDGVFEAEVTRTVADAKNAVTGFNARRAKLFFDGPATWSSLQLLTGPAATAAMTAPKATAAVVPPAVAPATTNPAAAITTPPAAAPPKVAATDRIVIGTLEAKKAPILQPIPGLVTFHLPTVGKAWTGGNGIVLSPGASWERVGTIWYCDNFSPRPNGATFIHPFRDGHVMINVSFNRIGYRNDGTLSVRRGAYTDLPLTPEGNAIMPIHSDKKHTARSEFSPDGTCKVYVDGVLAATAKFTESKPVDLGNGLAGPNVPPKLAKGQAAVFVDHGEKTLPIVGDLSLYPAK